MLYRPDTAALVSAAVAMLVVMMAKAQPTPALERVGAQSFASESNVVETVLCHIYSCNPCTSMYSGYKQHSPICSQVCMIECKLCRVRGAGSRLLAVCAEPYAAGSS